MRCGAKRFRIALVALALAVIHTSGHAATIVINNIDGANEGFNDTTPVAPVGGNPGTTLGAQRLNAFQYAADLWGACLESNVTIVVDAKMDPQFCSSSQAVLGSASASFVHSDFPNAPKAGTWYPQALANSLAGAHLNPGTADITATFNSNINGNPGCIGGRSWYYGYDASPPGNDVDFVSVVTHEIGHGIGFQTFMSSGGAYFLGNPDTYLCNMYHVGNVPPDYPSMTVGQRGTCNLADPNLVWDGACANLLGNAILSAGLTSGRVRLHGPNPYQGGSSLSHWSTGLSPNRLMEPSYSGPDHDIDLELQLLKDIGWVLTPKCDPVVLACGPLKEQSCGNALWTFQIQVDNNGTEDACTVTGELCEELPWLTITDPTCDYGNINAASSAVGLDSYTIDMNGWPGEPFMVRLKLTYDDGCGVTFTDTLDKVLDRPRPQIVCGPGPAKEDALDWPDWSIRVRLDNIGETDALNVTGLFCDTISTITIGDPTSSYGTIAVMDTSCGVDTYTFDLDQWSGGSFDVLLKVTYEDSCEIVYADTLHKVLSPPEAPVGLPGAGGVLAYRLAQNYPNPFNPTTVIAYAIPRAGDVDLRIYDVSGRLVRTLVETYKSRGRYQALWDGRDTAGRRVASGVYFYRMRAGDFTRTRRMVLLK